MGIKLCMLILATIWVSYTEARAVQNKEVSEKATTVADSKKQELEELLAIVQYALNKESSQVQNSEYANSEFYEKMLDKISHEEVASEQADDDDDSDGDNDDGLDKKDMPEKDGLSSNLADAEGEGEEGDMSDMKDKDSAEDGNAVSGPSDSDDEEEDINMQKAKKYEEDAAAEDSAKSVLAMEDDGLLDLNRARQQAKRRSTYFDRLIRALTSLSKVENDINRALKKICSNIG